MTRLPVGASLLVALASGCAAEPLEAPPNTPPITDDAHATLPWAFVINDPPPDDDEPADPDEIVTVPGSSLSMRRGDISLANGPPDWHPEGHPPMPEVVARGGGGDVMACAYCHLPNGQGKPENAGLAGQPFEYLVQQMEDYRAGRRQTGEPEMRPPSLMMRIGAATTDEQAREAAEYFSSMQFQPWIRVVETDEVPATRFSGWIHEVVEGTGTEPLGTRIVEVPEDPELTRLRDDASGFIAYVPTGAVARGDELVNGGGDGRTVPCTICHGEDLRGLGPVPALAGRSPSYMARQLYDLKLKNRDGAWADLMDAAVANLTVADIVDIVAYAASLEP